MAGILAKLLAGFVYLVFIAWFCRLAEFCILAVLKGRPRVFSCVSFSFQKAPVVGESSLGPCVCCFVTQSLSG